MGSGSDWDPGSGSDWDWDPGSDWDSDWDPGSDWDSDWDPGSGSDSDSDWDPGSDWDSDWGSDPLPGYTGTAPVRPHPYRSCSQSVCWRTGLSDLRQFPPCPSGSFRHLHRLHNTVC